VKRLPLILLLAGMLGGCSYMSGYLGGEDNAEPPAKLEKLQDPVALKRLWSAHIGVGYDSQFVRLVPAVSDEYLLAADRKGRVAAYAAGSGKRLWEIRTDAPISAGPGVGDDLVLLGTSDARILALALEDGELLWETNVSSEVLSVPQIDRGVVVVQSIDGNVTGLDAADGRQLWIYDRDVPVLTLRGTSTPAVGYGAVIAGFASGKVAALTIDQGFVAWETSVAVPKGRSEIERMVDIDGDPVIMGGAVYVVTYQGRVAVIDAQSGNLGWTRDLSSYAGLGVDFAQVYITDQDSNVWALTRDSGGSVWKQDKLSNRSLTAPTPINNYVAVGDFEGYVHLLSRYDGHIAGRIKIDSKGVSARPLVVGDVMYVNGNGGTLAAYTLDGG
jgi:outer membrane protein assembly factor BamB